MMDGLAVRTDESDAVRRYPERSAELQYGERQPLAERDVQAPQRRGVERPTFRGFPERGA